MEVYGKSMVAGPTNVVYLSTILGHDGPIPVHKCDRKCDNEHVCGNMYICKLTGFTHICDKNCNQRILYDNHNSLCRVSGQIFPLTQAEEQAVRGVRRKLDADNSPSDACAFKRRRDAQCHPSPFERSFSAVSPICSKVGDGMDTSQIVYVVRLKRCFHQYMFLRDSSLFSFRGTIMENRLDVIGPACVQEHFIFLVMINAMQFINCPPVVEDDEQALVTFET